MLTAKNIERQLNLFYCWTKPESTIIGYCNSSVFLFLLFRRLGLHVYFFIWKISKMYGIYRIFLRAQSANICQIQKKKTKLERPMPVSVVEVERYADYYDFLLYFLLFFFLFILYFLCQFVQSTTFKCWASIASR